MSAWGIVVNDVAQMTCDQTTWELGVGLARRGHGVFFFGVGDLALTPGGTTVAHAARPLGQLEDDLSPAITLGGPRALALEQLSAVVVRTSPGRANQASWLHATGLSLLSHVAARGTPVLNSPEGLIRAGSKLALTHLPADLRPETLVSRDPDELRAFAADQPTGAVLKPLTGSRGAGVFRVRPGDSDNVGTIVDLLRGDGWVMAQAYLPEASRGDVRILLVDGRPLEVDGVVAAVARVPGSGDFRSNVHAGGRAERAAPTDAQLETARRAGAWLRAQGLFFAGLDLIGPHIVEMNVFSPGGLGDASRFTGKPFVAALVDALERRLGLAA